MSIPSQVPESSMEEILASIRKIISEDESKALDQTAAPEPSRSRPSPPSDNVSPLFVGRPGAAYNCGDRVESDPAPKTPPAETRGNTPAYIRPAEAAEARPKADLHPSARLPEPVLHRENAGRRLLSPTTEAAVGEALTELKTATARSDPLAVETLAESLMRPMVKAWLDENLTPLVERIVREEIERISRRR